MNMFALSQTYLKRAEYIEDLLAIIGNIKCLINSELLKNLRKRVKQQEQKKDANFVRSEKELLQFFCENDTTLTWDDVFDKLIESQNCRTNVGIPISQMLAISQLICSNIVTHSDEMEISLSSSQLKDIIRMMPVIFVESEKCKAFINLHELVMSPGALECLLFPKHVDVEETVTDFTAE